MKKLFILLFLSCMYLSCNAQTTKSGIRVHYAVTFHSFYGQERASQDEMVLEVDGIKSHFYSLWSVSRAEIVDSVSRAGGNYGDMDNAYAKLMYPRARHHYRVWKNCPERNKLTYTDVSLTHFRFTAPLEQPVWTIEDRDSVICEYACRFATADYLGRKWQVWFAKDIPVSDGPWYLHGLPGLILEAKDSEGFFTFSCMEVRNGTLRSLDVPQKKYAECTQDEYYSLQRLSWKDPDAYVERLTGFRGEGYDANGKPLKHPERKAMFLDKRFEE